MNNTQRSVSYLVPPSLDDLPSPPPGKLGWPWTESSDPYPATRVDGSHWPSLRVVSPSYGQAEYIEETIRSVLLQGYPRLQYLVIDGGSTDETVAILEKYSPWLSGWVSELDDGQVDAILKGLDGADTDYWTWLNSDDVFCKNALRIFEEAKSNTAVSGQVMNFDENGVSQIKENSGLTMQEYSRRWSSSVFHQPGVFWPVSADLIEKLDRRYHYCFDAKLLLWYLYLYGGVNETAHPVAKFRIHDTSKSVSQSEQFAPEMYSILGEMGSELRKRSNNAIARNIEQKQWSVYLQISRSKHKKLKSVGGIVKGIVQKPNRLNRETLGALRQLFLRGGDL